MAATGKEAPEVLVIGGGMAGVIAALSARREGRSVLLVRWAYGATALSSGAIDVAADPSATPEQPRGRELPWAALAAEHARLDPDHPYAVLADRLSELEEAMAFAVSELGGLLSEKLARNRFLGTPMGTAKPAALCQASMAAGDLLAIEGPLALAHFPVVSAYDGPYIASGLERARQALGRGAPVLPVQSSFFGKREDALKHPHELAAAFEQAGALESFVAELRPRLPAGAKGLLLPPFLHRCDAAPAVKAIGEALGMPAAELVSALPSVPGLRLQQALDLALENAGVELCTGSVSALGIEGPFRVSGESAEPSELSARSVVLATGKFIGGGITREKVFAEPVFGLPVHLGARKLSREFIGDLLSPRPEQRQEAFRVGLRIDAGLRPLGEDGLPASARLFAAGSVIAGYDPASDKTGLGVAIFTGYLAGKAAASVA